MRVHQNMWDSCTLWFTKLLIKYLANPLYALSAVWKLVAYREIYDQQRNVPTYIIMQGSSVLGREAGALFTLILVIDQLVSLGIAL